MIVPSLSIIIPVLNEKENISHLLERIDKALSFSNISYEIIVVDDHSTDGSFEILKSYEDKYPLHVYLKEGSTGKSSSLVQGFDKASGCVLVMIDADLQYPPEVIPAMFEKISKGEVDIVVGDRREFQVSQRRKIISRVFYRFFGKFLHGFNVDVQSGIKAFRKEIVERINLHPSSPWTFDLEFLVKAKQAGYKVTGIPILFHKREGGKPKINLLKASFEIGLSALKLKFAAPQTIPLHPQVIKRKGHGFHYKGVEYIPHSELLSEETALYRLNRSQIRVLLIIIFAVLASFLANWHFTLVALTAALTFLYFTDLLYNFFLIVKSFSHSPEIHIKDKDITAITDDELPVYTIFCPLYREWRVLPQFVTAMSRLSYPKDKLQVILLMEEDDRETVRHAREYKLPSYFEIAVVADSIPKTKPKALNYGLTKTRGEFVTIYDAEDIPDPLQLKKAFLAFGKNDRKLACLQAKLNFYNPHQNILTRVFTAEYALWFDLVLTGLQSSNAPIPLGGTSNHFRTEDIKKLKGWDAFNVTEDCDLGMRLVKNGFRTGILDSYTQEEANSNMVNWIRQRSRWIKGYIQTYFVHMRNPGSFMIDLKNHDLLTFQLIVGGKILSMFINPFMWATTIAYFALRAIVGPFIESIFPPVIFYMAVFSLVFGNFLYMYYYMIGCAKREYEDIIKYVFLVPFYWLGMSIAAWIAVIEIIRRPHHWAKTHHGLHLSHTRAKTQAKNVIGQDLIDEKIARYPIELTPPVTLKPL